MRPLALLLLTACLEGSSGTAVGNPGKLELTAASVPGDLALDRVELTLDSARITDCDGIELELTLPDEPLGSQGEGLTIPGGTFCTMTLSAQVSGLLLEGETDGGTFFQLAYTPDPFAWDRPFRVDGDAFLLSFDITFLVESGAAIDAADLDGDGQVIGGMLEDGTDADLIPTAPPFTGELWSDTDSDGSLGPDDLPPSEPPSCATAPPAGPTPALCLLALLGLRSRRRD